jgi:nanoRNase/pAp phosphatase (c-di-AMP/oligoRNAs hydrolase)
VSKRISEHYQLALGDRKNLGQYDHVIVVDTSTPNLIQDYEQTGDEIIIDHHPKGTWISPNYFIDENATSCAELVYDILKEKNEPLDSTTAAVLALGVLSDTSHFRHANARSLRKFVSMVEEGNVELEDLFQLMHSDYDVSQKVSVLKGAQRLKFERFAGYIIATTEVSTHESSVCKSLLGLGADVCFVGSQRYDEYRIVCRARASVVEKGLHLGALMKGLGAKVTSDGGGHDGAAGLTGVGDLEANLNFCMERTRAELRSLNR